MPAPEQYNSDVKLRAVILCTSLLWVICAVLVSPDAAAQDQKQDQNQKPAQDQSQNQQPADQSQDQTPALKPRPHSNSSQSPSSAEQYTDEDGLIHRPNPEQSTSKAQPIDLSAPDDDAKSHPNSAEAVREAEDAAGLLQDDELGGIQEFHPWDPHKSQKDIEVGDFYYRQGNYFGALSRYQEALYYKSGDAIATYKIAMCQEKTGESDDARKGYEAYLKILPEGPYAADAKKALARLGPASDEQPDGKKPDGNKLDGNKDDPAVAKPSSAQKQ